MLFHPSAEDASENEIGKLRNQVLGLQFALRLVPLVDPVDHAEECKRGGPRAHAAGRACATRLRLDFGNEALDEVDVIFLPRIDELAQPRRQGMVMIDRMS